MPRSKPPACKRADSPGQKDARRQLILRAAKEELARFNATGEDFTFHALAKRAGLAPGTIYLYFDSKIAILQTLFEEAALSLIDELIDKTSKLPGPVTARQVAHVFRDALMQSAKSRRMPQLLKSLSKGSQSERPRQPYVAKVVPAIQKLEGVLIQRLPGLLPNDTFHLLMLSWSLLLGLSEIVGRRIPSPKPNPAPTENVLFKSTEVELGEALTMLIEGYLSTSSARKQT